ncbi:response regulator [Phenylobacterium sp. J367]|uniref:ATP-binding response regulator n=1 Tax=Phenylobacterium sp. J367 TaxID=2898435 RepID=UPI0021508B5B|nr:response regulator [Phenylobacterium sp. J367]MCR5878774.1 response regulator [Phenylobacterium sp. J367]
MSLPAFFFDRVSAEIRQQMGDILALSEQLQRQRLPADSAACVTGVVEAAETVRRTFESAIDLKAVLSDGLTLTPAPFSLREVMDTLQTRWHGRARAAGVTLLVSFTGDPDAAVVGDRTRLLQVFDGFLGEAVASSAGAAVEASLKAAREGETVRLEGRVRGARSDAWSGDDLEARVRNIAGRFGLEVAIGVMLARQVVEGHAGLVREDAGPGAAQTVAFDLRLPAAAEAPAEPQSASERPLHVLIVDDNATNRVVAQALCEMLQCTTETAEDGLQAVEAVRSTAYDLILMDIRMPGMDGVTATRTIRAMPGRAGETPIIALTANADPDEARAYIEAGMLGVIEKPMKADHLRTALIRALGDPAEVQAA